ncbi:MAG: hypothetical protein RLZZ271_731 [Pseudomonadota bacterium]|jgi:hypothetical protein
MSFPGESSSPLLVLLDLIRRAREATSSQELAFLAVNDTHALSAYRQGALWFRIGGVKCLSGVIQPEINAPYVHWLQAVCSELSEKFNQITPVYAVHLSEPHGPEWADWLPENGLWVPVQFKTAKGEVIKGGLLLASDAPWTDHSCSLIQEWMAAWSHEWQGWFKPAPWSWANLRYRISRWWSRNSDQVWWKQTRWRISLAILLLLLWPVRLTVLAQGELVPANPATIRAPMDGVLGQFHVNPNEVVKVGQPLFSFEESSLTTRRDVAAQTLATAEAEYRQFVQQALSDNKSKSQLTMLKGKIEEKRAEADYLNDQLARSRVVAPQAGIVMFDDPSEWIGRPVQTGERVMRIAAPGDVEIEAWLSLGDAIPLPEKAQANLYLSAYPLSSVSAQVRYVAHDAIPRPSGSYAYRVRAKLDDPTSHRVGLKGTVKLHGNWVPLIYWVLRRPVATIRELLGV